MATMVLLWDSQPPAANIPDMRKYEMKRWEAGNMAIISLPGGISSMDMKSHESALYTVEMT